MCYHQSIYYVPFWPYGNLNCFPKCQYNILLWLFVRIMPSGYNILGLWNLSCNHNVLQHWSQVHAFLLVKFFFMSNIVIVFWSRHKIFGMWMLQCRAMVWTLLHLDIYPFMTFRINWLYWLILCLLTKTFEFKEVVT